MHVHTACGGEKWDLIREMNYYSGGLQIRGKSRHKLKKNRDTRALGHYVGSCAAKGSVICLQ